MRCHVPLLPDRTLNFVPDPATVNAPSGSFAGGRKERAIAECEYPVTSLV
jgi:hypothetical protein